MAFPRILAFSLVAGVFLPGASLLAEELPDRPVFSKHIHDAILAGFRQGEPTVPAPETAAPADVEPGVILLPKLNVMNNPGSGNLSQDVLTPKTEAVPLVLGTGVTEIKGKKFTVLIRRLFFIPIAFKLEW
jgi:hypothetical protein